MPQIPMWIAVLQALLTPTIAASAIYIGFLQWRTAQHKFMFELSARRMNIIDDALALHADAAKNKIDQHDFYKRWKDIALRARYVFGQEVVDFFDDAFDKIHEGVLHEPITDLTHFDLDERRDLKRLKRLYKTTLLDFKENLFIACNKYVHFKQKEGETLTEWFVRKNKIRLSYADKKQLFSKSDVLYENSQWILKKDKIITASFEPRYEISINRLSEIQYAGATQYYSWPLHLSEKNWVDLSEFEDVVEVALREIPHIAHDIDREKMKASFNKVKKAHKTIICTL